MSACYVQIQTSEEEEKIKWKTNDIKQHYNACSSKVFEMYILVGCQWQTSFFRAISYFILFMNWNEYLNAKFARNACLPASRPPSRPHNNTKPLLVSAILLLVCALRKLENAFTTNDDEDSNSNNEQLTGNIWFIFHCVLWVFTRDLILLFVFWQSFQTNGIEYGAIWNEYVCVCIVIDTLTMVLSVPLKFTQSNGSIVPHI